MTLDHGAAVSQKGYDVKTCDDRFLVYSSAWPILKIFNVSVVTGFKPSNDYNSFTANINDTLTSVGNVLINGDPVQVWSDGTLPAPLSDTTTYYVINKSGNTFKLSTIRGGSAVNITDTGSSTHYYQYVSDIVTVTHNLGYISPFLVMYNGSTTIGVTDSYLNSPSVIPFTFLDVVDEYIHVEQFENKLEIAVSPFFDDEGGAVAGDTIYFTVYMFLDNFDTVDAKKITTGTSSGASSTDYGIRISKDGFDVKSCDDIDCVLSSSFFTQIIHMKGIDTSGTNPITITHDLGYIPSYLMFTKEASADDHIRLFTQVEATTTTLSIFNGYAYEEFYYIIFKQKND